MQAGLKNWMKAMPAEELRTYRRAGFLAGMEPGEQTALVVVDVTYDFIGSEGLTLEQAIEEFPTACGPVGWETLPRIARLIDMFRESRRPIIFTRGDPDAVSFAGKATKGILRPRSRDPRYNTFPPLVSPCEGEWVLNKTKASCFFQTPLTAYLIKRGIDTLVICGVSTSGCVRASVVDAFSHGFSTFVIDDCCFDRSHFAHCANLFDIHAKYASVLSLDVLAPMMKSEQSESAAAESARP